MQDPKKGPNGDASGYMYVCGTFIYIYIYVAIFGFFGAKQQKQLVLQCFEAASSV